MKFQKLMHALLGIGMSCMLLGTTVFAKSTDTVTNHGYIGAVDIEVVHTFTDSNVAITPNATVGIQSRVKNIAKPAWIRARIDYPFFTSDYPINQELELPSDVLVKFADEKWKKIGPWYYYLEPVPSDAEIPFTESITFPSDWDSSYVNAEFDMVFTAEAVQERNFDPDFTAEDPWHGVVIEAYDSNNYQLSKESNEHFELIYEGGSKGLLHAGDDFFANWGKVLPGDVLEGEADITNRMKFPVKLYFSADSNGDAELLDLLHLKIWSGDNVVFDGPLSKKLPKTLLGTYEPNSDDTFKYELSCPAEVNNDFAQKAFQAVWTFSCEEMLPEEQLPPKEMVKRLVEKIETWDVPLVGVAIGIAGCMAVLTVCGIAASRKRGGRRG